MASLLGRSFFQYINAKGIAMGTSKIIDVLIALDVEEILKNYPSLSQSKEQPTLLTNAVDCIYMLTTRANAVYGYGRFRHCGTCLL